MVENNIKVIDKERAISALCELCNIIDMKSAIATTDDNMYNDEKHLDDNLLKRIFISINLYDKRILVWDEIKNKFNLYKRQEIEKEFENMLSIHKNKKRIIIDKLGCFDINQDSWVLIESLYQKVSMISGETIVYAILVDIVGEKLQEKVL